MNNSPSLARSSVYGLSKRPAAYATYYVHVYNTHEEKEEEEGSGRMQFCPEVHLQAIILEYTRVGQDRILQGDNGGLRLDFVDFDSGVLPVCQFAHTISAQLSPTKAEFGRKGNKPSQQNVVLNHHGHPVE